MPSTKFTQPFTLQEAIGLEPGVITEEIARLQNSLQHLQETQQQLQEYLETSSPNDQDILEAVADNRVVTASQTERISILRLALERKGVVSSSNPHYDLPTRPNNPPSSEPSTNIPAPPQPAPHPPNEEGNGGVFL